VRRFPVSRTRRFFAVLGWTFWLALAAAVSARWISHAQTTQPATDDPRFTGVSTGLEATGLSVSRRRFEPGARSAWHFHDHGQLLFVEEGRARTQKRGGPMKEMGPGESDYTPPKIEHWHGAAPHEHFVQVAVGFGSGITWLEKTTDAEYDGATRED
jgi:quercetin dioxygenase-like cupin family protein